MMKLREQFEKYNYKSILQNDELCSLDISYFLDENKKVPEELLDIYISSQEDEIFILLNGDKKDIHTMCDEWDNRVSIFVAFGSENRSLLRKMKYNIIEIILCKDKQRDRSEEGSLKVTRKIILSYDIESDGTIVIPDTEAVEIPFYMIPTSDFLLNEENKKTLKKCMPKEDLKILFQENKKGRGINSTFEKEYYDKIEEWLKDVYQERESN